MVRRRAHGGRVVRALFEIDEKETMSRAEFGSEAGLGSGTAPDSPPFTTLHSPVPPCPFHSTLICRPCCLRSSPRSPRCRYGENGGCAPVWLIVPATAKFTMRPC